MTAEDILPLVAALAPAERARLLRLISRSGGEDAGVYRSLPVQPGEFSAEDEPLAWEADGWEDVA